MWTILTRIDPNVFMSEKLLHLFYTLAYLTGTAMTCTMWTKLWVSLIFKEPRLSLIFLSKCWQT